LDAGVTGADAELGTEAKSGLKEGVLSLIVASVVQPTNGRVKRVRNTKREV
jgi:hypothetical protein